MNLNGRWDGARSTWQPRTSQRWTSGAENVPGTGGTLEFGLWSSGSRAPQGRGGEGGRRTILQTRLPLRGSRSAMRSASSTKGQGCTRAQQSGEEDVLNRSHPPRGPCWP